MTTPTPPVFYGIWRSGQGWLRADGKVCAYQIKEIAERVASRMGGRVEFIDESIQAMEQELLAREANGWKSRILSKLLKGKK